MKKFASFLMIFAMLASLCAVGVSAEKGGGQTNMEVTVPKFTAQPTFDGKVTEDEWGDATVHMVTDGAATLLNADKIGENEKLGLKNYFYWTEFEGFYDSLAYDLWIRWDDEYLYVAAIVNDPDPFSADHDGDNTWSNDMIQMYVDDLGPSSIMLNEDKEFNYKTDSFNGNRWSTAWKTQARFSTEP